MFADQARRRVLKSPLQSEMAGCPQALHALSAELTILTYGPGKSR